MANKREPAEAVDPATAAFARLEGEIALLRRGVENLAAEKASIEIPDYSTTLGEMAQSLDEVNETLASIAENPAMIMTPEDMAQRIDRAARSGRQSDREQITAAENRYDHAMRALTKVAAAAVSESTGKPVVCATELAVTQPDNPAPASVAATGRYACASAERAVAALDAMVAAAVGLEGERT